MTETRDAYWQAHDELLAVNRTLTQRRTAVLYTAAVSYEFHRRYTAWQQARQRYLTTTEEIR